MNNKCCMTCKFFSYENKEYLTYDKSDIEDIDIIKKYKKLAKCLKRGYLNKKIKVTKYYCNDHQYLVYFGEKILI